MTRRNLICWLLFPAALLIGSGMPGWAGETAVGEIVECVGTAHLVRSDGEERPCAPGLAFRTGDALRTGEDGRMKCRLADGGSLSLGADSELAAEEAALLASDEEPLIFRLTLGVLRAVFPQSDSAPEIHTPTAVIGVRGTAYEVAFALDTETAVAVDEGAVLLAVEDQPAETEISAGQLAEFSTVEPQLRLGDVESPERRDWAKWRERREANIAQGLKRLKPFYEAWRRGTENRLPRRAGNLEATCRKMQGLLAEMEAAQSRGDRRSFRQARRKFRKALPRFRRAVRQTRRQFNRLKSIAGHCHHIGPFLDRNPDRFTAAESRAIRKSAGKIMDLEARMDARFASLKRLVRETVQTLGEERSRFG
ncbi:MAG: FecR domain-containing protein [Desulfococcaceae bacterium]